VWENRDRHCDRYNLAQRGYSVFLINCGHQCPRGKMAQVSICIASNAGGVGKTAIATATAYNLAQRGYSVTLFDLDPQCGLDLACGLEPAPPEASIAGVLDPSFRGDWPLVNAVWHPKLSVCQGHDILAQVQSELVVRMRSEYTLADRLTDHPIATDVLIFDCPATRGILVTNAVVASTHLLVPVSPEGKAYMVPSLLKWFYATTEGLRLKPMPQLLGLVLTNYDKQRAQHRTTATELPKALESSGIKLFPPVRHSREVAKAMELGIPLAQHRPGNPARADFYPIADEIARILESCQLLRP